MNKAHFKLILDTTGPQITIEAPTYTTTTSPIVVTVSANEQLDLYQEVYIIDINGVRHNLTFDHEGDYLIGVVSFDSFDLGIVTLYARVRDVVHNLSNLASTSIHIMEGHKLYLDTEIRTWDWQDKIITWNIDTWIE